MILGEGPWRRYFLVCTNPIMSHWWDRMMRPGFRHCYVLIWEGAAWLYADPTLSRTHVSILDYYENEHPAEWIEDSDASVIEVEVCNDPYRLRSPWIIGPMTCVEGCKALLGIRSFWLWSPLRLARYLEKYYGIRSQEAKEDSRGKGVDCSPGTRARSNWRRSQREEA